jgi:hypothetical protein
MSTTAVQSGTVHGLDLSVSANNPCPRTVRAHRRGHKLSASANASRFQQSVGRHWQRTQTVRRQSAVSHRPCPRTRRGREFAVTLGWQGIVRAISCWLPYYGQHASRSVSDLSSPFHPMSSFDPTTVRKAVEEFTPSRPQKFQDLFPAKDVIAELRHKRASYRAIADLLTKHCLPTSKTAIAAFCHQVLGEIVRPRRRPGRKRTFVSSNGEPAPASPQPNEPDSLPEPIANPVGGSTPQKPSRGPRIAQVRILKPPGT